MPLPGPGNKGAGPAALQERPSANRMCTITYLPLSSGSFLLTQNRDESPQRPAAVFPAREERGNRQLLFPKDPAGGGSWIATDEISRLVCIMNGGTGQHQPDPPYRMSRGQVLLDAAATPSFREFASQYPLEGIEPFTLLFFEQDAIQELKWDARQKHRNTYDPAQPHIWSAPQLYTPEQHRLRENWFKEWLAAKPGADHSAAENPAFTPEAALEFHIHGGDGNPEHSLLLNRNGLVKTTSITQAIVRQGSIELRHIPLANS